MPGRGRRGPLSMLLGGLIALLSLVVPAGQIAASGLGVSSGLDVDVAGVDTDAVVAAAAADHVAVLPGAVVNRAALVAEVNRARAANIALTVVILPDRLSPDDARLVSSDLLRQLRGTVLVLTPDGYAAESDSVGDSLMSDALDAVGSTGGDDVAATAAFVDALTAEPFPWTLILLIAGGLVGMAGFGIYFWSKRRREGVSAADTVDRLRQRVAAMADNIMYLADHVEAAADPAMGERFAAASGEYNALRDALAAAPADQRAPAGLTARTNALRDELAAIRNTVDPPGPRNF